MAGNPITHAARIALLALCVAAAIAPTAPAAATTCEWLILAHLDARGGLDQAARVYQESLIRATARHGFALALQKVSDAPAAGRLTRELRLPGVSPASRQTLESLGAATDLSGFYAWANAQAAASHQALLIMGHGAGLLRSRASEAAPWPGQLRDGLRSARAAHGRPLDVVALDTCYGSTLEVAYDLRGVCRYLTGTPGLIYAPGLDWEGALSDLSLCPDAPTLVRGLVGRGMPPGKRPQVLSAVDMRRVEPVTELVAELAAHLRGDLENQGPVLRFVRSRCPSWGERQELVDLGALAAGLAENAAGERTRRLARCLHEAVEQLTIAVWSSGGDTGSGVAIYFPPTFEAVPPEYEQSLEFAPATGWADLLKTYWQQAAQLIGAE